VRLLLLLLALAPPLPPAGEPVQVTATADKPEVTVGETFTLEVKASGPEGTAYTFPADASTDVFELRTPAATPAAPAPALPPSVHRYVGEVFALGHAEIPPIPVRYRLPNGTSGEAHTAPVTVRVVSILPKGEEPKLADVRPPVAVGVGRAFWIALGVAGALLAVLVVWLLRRRRRLKPVEEAPAPPVPPDVEALHALDALAARGLLARGELRPFYIALTTVAKRYLERRLAAPVLEMTTAETLAFLRVHPRGDGLHPTVRDLAEAADRIKFGRGQGVAAEAERHLGAVRGLVQAFEASLAPPPVTGEGKAA
jgi:hypothetical protein